MTWVYALCESRNQGTIGQRYQVKERRPVDPLETPVEELRRGYAPGR
jgi:hypothetical protein